MPNIICVLILLFIVPESPKFTYSQGNEEKTLRIFRKIYRINTGKSVESYEVSNIIKNKEFGESCSKSSQGFLKFMWSQTTPLFKGSHLRNILTACFIQFSVCLTTNGFWTFLPEIMNKISLWNKSQKVPATVCEIFTFKNISESSNGNCVQKLEIAAYIHVFENILFLVICFSIMTFLINRVGKLVILTFILFLCGSSAVALIFVRFPTLSSYLYIVLLGAGVAISVVNASSVELFPTKMRSMAICLSMMTGRFGSVVGSLIIGAVIEDHCRMTFLMPTVLLYVSLVLGFTIPHISKRIK